MEEQIDDNLRRVYAQAVEQDVPERFLRLLDELRKKDRDTRGTDAPESGAEN
jgi:hypothetical protein